MTTTTATSATTTQQAEKLSPLWEGVLWKLAACFFFACINGVVRSLSGGAGEGVAALPSSLIAFWQNVIGCALILPFVWTGGVWQPTSGSVKLHTIRVLTAAIGVIFWYSSLKYMTLAEAVALGFTGPIFSVIGARLYLGEKLTGWRLSGIMVGFVGAFLISRPDRAIFGDETFHWAMIYPLLSAIAIAWSKLASRRLGSGGESPRLMTLYLLVFMAPVSLLPGLFEWVWPTSDQWVSLVALGFLAAAAHFATAKAYQLAEVTFLTPFGFARLLFSALIGFAAFGELPKSSAVWVGACVILFSTYLLTREQASRMPA